MVLIKHAAMAAFVLAVATTPGAAQARGRSGGGGRTIVGDSVLYQRVDTILQRLSARSRPLLFGFALECVDCQPGARGRGAGGAAVVWSYKKNPRVVAVAPGSAAEQAGIRAGDLLTTIDDLSLLTDAGAQRFARAVSGETVRLTFERDTRPITVTLLLGERPGPGRGGVGPARITDGYIAFKGTVNGEMSMEIWSDDPIVSQDSANVVTLRIGTRTVIKLQRTNR